MKLLLYCTKAKPYLKYSSKLNGEDDAFYIDNSNVLETKTYNGKIVAECDFEVEKMGLDTGKGLVFDKGFNKESQLELSELAKYVGNNYYYAIHIKNLHIFDKLKKIASYSSKQGYKIFKAPQNMQYAYEFTDKKGQQYVLISIKPEWLCKILNGEKTVEVRKKILKEML